jgi:hypothetical protein
MQRLEVSGAVRHIYTYMSLGVKWLSVVRSVLNNAHRILQKLVS